MAKLKTSSIGFLINLGLKLGAAFTERTTYTGIFNISGLGFDMLELQSAVL